jgi:hypothetical protein
LKADKIKIKNITVLLTSYKLKSLRNTFRSLEENSLLVMVVSKLTIENLPLAMVLSKISHKRLPSCDGSLKN